MSDPVYKVGTVIQWSDGKRGILRSYSSGIYGVDRLSGGRDYMDEGHVLANSYQTMVQPGQIYQAAVHSYKVLAPFSGTKWTCSVESAPAPGFPHVNIEESDLLGWMLIDGLDVNPLAPPRKHGPHTCPRCGQGGALIMAVRTVYCTNPDCPCYSKP